MRKFYIFILVFIKMSETNFPYVLESPERIEHNENLFVEEKRYGKKHSHTTLLLIVLFVLVIISLVLFIILYV